MTALSASGVIADQLLCQMQAPYLDVNLPTGAATWHQGVRRFLARRTTAAVPRIATVALAAPIVASRRPRRRAPTACLPSVSPSSASNAVTLSCSGRQPAARSRVEGTTHG